MAWFRMMGVDSVEYHRRTVLGRADDFEGGALAYYGSRGETPLQWGGRLADRLALVGAVDDYTYEAIFGRGGARDPHLGTRLVATRRPGVDLVVAAHKSVAVLGLIGRADDMHAILDAESDATLAFLDEWFSHQGGRRGKSQHRTATSGLLWARTRHATSRAGDPSPHDHVLIANLTEMLDAEGSWKALDTAEVRDLTHAATMAGRLAAAAKAVETRVRHRARPRAVREVGPLDHCRHPRCGHRPVLEARDGDRCRHGGRRVHLSPRPRHHRPPNPPGQERRVARVADPSMAGRDSTPSAGRPARSRSGSTT